MTSKTGCQVKASDRDALAAQLEALQAAMKEEKRKSSEDLAAGRRRNEELRIALTQAYHDRDELRAQVKRLTSRRGWWWLRGNVEA
jgi:predicted RNase H-like nuclease (RuvC/YqgF family)